MHREHNTRIRFNHRQSSWRAVIHGLAVALVALFVVLGPAAGLAGSLTPVAMLLAGLLVVLNSLGYAELASSVPSPGGAYSLAREGSLGSALGFITGWSLALAGLGLAGLLAQGAAQHLGLLLGALPAPTPAPALVAAGLVALVALEAGLGRGSRWRLLLTLLLLGLPAVLAVLAAPHLAATAPAVAGARPAAAIPLLLAAFVGIEAAAGEQGEGHRPGQLARFFLGTPALVAALGAGLATLALHVGGPQGLAGATVPLAPLGWALAGARGQAAVAALVAVALVLALRRALALVLRTLYLMSRDGFWPAWLARIEPGLGVPASLAVLAGVLVLPALWPPALLLGRLAGLFYLVTLVTVNLALAWRPQRERPQAFALPFHPWIPALAVAVDLLLLYQWGALALGLGLTLLALGGAVYLAYGRDRYVEAHENVTVFGPPEQGGEAPAFRVLLPVARLSELEPLLGLARRLAAALGGEVLLLHVVVVPPSLPLVAGRRRAQAERARLQKALEQAGGEGPAVATMARAARSVARGILQTAAEEKAGLVLLGWHGHVRPRSASLGRVLDAVLRDAPCDVVVVRGDEAAEARRILVPTAGGPHAQAAARLALRLAEVGRGRVTLLYVQRDPATPEQMEAQQRTLEETLSGIEPEQRPEQKVVQAPSVVEGIAREAEAHDLVLLGVSEESLLDRFAFGSVPLQVAARLPATALVQKHRGLTGLWTRRLLRTLQQALPPLSTAEALEVRQDLARAAKPGTNYFVLIVLSSIIAALGLVLDSPAVVIGAMLVAPLMSPVLAFSLGTTLGDLRLIRHAVEAIFKGVALALLIAAAIGLLSPFKTATGEMLARSRPNLLDMGVALASGLAGAYALARKDVSAALPGVAIAAALMPPLASVGLALAMGDPSVAGGAFLLFVANIAAIGLAGAVVFVLLGIHPEGLGPESRRWLRQRLIASALVVVAVGLPLAAIMNGIVREGTELRAVRMVVTRELAASDGELVDLEVHAEGEGLHVVATVRSAQPLAQADVGDLAQVLRSRLERPVRVEVVALPVMRAESD